MIFVTGIFSSRWIRFTSVENAVEVGVFISIVKRITIGVVVAWVTGLGRVAVSTVDLNAVTDAIAIGIRRGRVGQQREGLVGIVESITVGVILPGMCIHRTVVDDVWMTIAIIIVIAGIS